MPTYFRIMAVLLLSFFMCHPGGHMPQRGLCAHRGASHTHPENTLTAFREAIRLGAHMIEFDVQLSRDSVVVIMHHASVDRTTDGSGRVADLTLAELKTLDAGSWKGEQYRGERVPTLQEALAIMPNNVWLNIHIKGGAAVGIAVAKMIEREKRIQQSFLACRGEVAEAVKKLNRSIKICNMDRGENSAAYIEGTIHSGADFIQLTVREDDRLAEYVRILHQQRIKINYYGADSADKLRELFDVGVDFPLVDDIAGLMNEAVARGIEPVHPRY